jgi:predicted ATPase/DNA-binding winged helix-turn-helix (wHTH) protein
MNSGSELPAQITFGRFRLMPHRREILLEDQPIRLGSRAFDVLMALIEARGSVVSKDDLMARVWPNQMVEENNLEVQVSTLRAVLGAERALIRTVSRRGYQFTGELRFPPENVEVQANIGPETNLPQPVSKLIGRDDDLDEILRLAAAQRLVTLTGTGGIGKTRLALAVGQRLLPQFGDGVWLVELAPLTDPGLLPTAVAAAIGLELVDGTVTAERVASALTGKELVLLLDNCEHQLDAAALIAEALLRANRSALVIATSREPLRVEGEQIYPVPPLSVPAATIGDNTDTLEYAAVQLFVEKARAAKFEFAPDERSMAMLAAICRRLDGIPLAIELAAARVAALGIEELNVRLDECLSLLTGGRRTALPRQQTLRATLDWSYRLLPESERVLLRRLAIFAGQFSLEAAATVAASLDLSELDTIDCLSNLVAKSLVVRDVKSAIARYRLLDTTRAYALEKLGESAERERIAHRHAEYYRDLFERAETEWRVRPAAEWLGEYAWRIDNLRAALDWAFSADGDATLGVALTVAAIPLWMHLSLLEECRGRLEKALAALRPGANRDARTEMKLHAALAASLRYTSAISETGAAWTKALEIAESLEDPEYQLRALWGLWLFHSTNARHRVALGIAQRLCTLAERWPNPNDRQIGERAMSISQHYLGDQSKARRHIERVLADYVIAEARPHLIHFEIDLRVMARVFFARILWLQGFPDEAMRAAERSVQDARVANHAISLCYALFMAACPIALAVGDLVAAEHYVSMLLDHSTRSALTFWAARGRSYQGALLITRGDVDTGLPLLRAGFDELGEARSAVIGRIELMMPEALGRAGQIAEGLAAIDEAINHSENTEERWMIAEMLRIKGELLLLQGGATAAAAAEDHFRQALDWAARQGALSWELRAAMSLAGLLSDQGRSADAKTLLQPVYDRFTEGFATADLKKAKLFLDSF